MRPFTFTFGSAPPSSSATSDLSFENFTAPKSSVMLPPSSPFGFNRPASMSLFCAAFGAKRTSELTPSSSSSFTIGPSSLRAARVSAKQ